jgi:hypothetical protein
MIVVLMTTLVSVSCAETKFDYSYFPQSTFKIFTDEFTGTGSISYKNYFERGHYFEHRYLKYSP